MYLFWRIKEKLSVWIAWRLPKLIVVWCFFRVFAYATSGKYGNQAVNELTAMDAINRFMLQDNEI